MIVLFVPETYSPVLLRKKARMMRKETGDERWAASIERMNKSVTKTVMWSCIRPFQLLFFEQMCLNLCLLSAILLGVLYLFFGVSSTQHSRQVFSMPLTHQLRLSLSCSRITTASTNGKPERRSWAFS